MIIDIDDEGFTTYHKRKTARISDKKLPELKPKPKAIPRFEQIQSWFKTWAN